MRLDADSVRLAQVFSNLLINAAKYTDPGGQIQLRAAREGGQIVVAIRDNGIGISPDMMPRLFTMFEQAQGALGRAEGGLGIGLSLVRGLVTLHGGSVEARSDGSGTGEVSSLCGCLSVRLRRRFPVQKRPNKVSSPAPASRSWLSMIIVMLRILAPRCWSRQVTTSRQPTPGQRALELAERFRPHALLLDIGLPDFDGYQLATAIRAAPWGRGIVLIAVTGWGQEEDRRRAFEAGCEHHLTKPIAAETVESLLQSLDPAFRGTR